MKPYLFEATPLEELRSKYVVGAVHVNMAWFLTERPQNASTTWTMLVHKTNPLHQLILCFTSIRTFSCSRFRCSSAAPTGALFSFNGTAVPWSFGTVDPVGRHGVRHGFKSGFVSRDDGRSALVILFCCFCWSKTSSDHRSSNV